MSKLDRYIVLLPDRHRCGRPVLTFHRKARNPRGPLTTRANLARRFATLEEAQLWASVARLNPATGLKYTPVVTEAPPRRSTMDRA